MRRSKRLVALARLETRRAGPAAAAAVAGVKTAKAPPPVLLYPLSSNALFGKLALSWTFLWCLWSWPAGQWWKNDDCWLHLGGANSTIYCRHDSQPPTHAQLFSKTFQMTIIYMVWNEKKNRTMHHFEMGFRLTRPPLFTLGTYFLAKISLPFINWAALSSLLCCLFVRS